MSVPGYLEEIRVEQRLPAANVTVVPAQTSDPNAVVEEAVQRLRTNGPFDRAFVVLDNDRAEAGPAIQRLRQYNVDARTGTRKLRKWSPPQDSRDRNRFELILSDPCFEFWLLLHFTFRRSAFVDAGGPSLCHSVIRELKERGIPAYSKGTRDLWSLTKLLYHDHAKPNAMRTLDNARATDRSNPSTNFFELVDAILEMGSER